MFSFQIAAIDYRIEVELLVQSSSVISGGKFASLFSIIPNCEELTQTYHLPNCTGTTKDYESYLVAIYVQIMKLQKATRSIKANFCFRLKLYKNFISLK